jgi:hypothetical protein
MIEEAYVSFETAKLLKKKGFNEPCLWGYDPYGASFARILHEPQNSELNEYEYSKPTQQMAMRWLREEHNVYINIAPTHNVVDGSINFLWLTYSSDYSVTGDCDIFYPTYEQAVEAAINYCLENLI